MTSDSIQTEIDRAATSVATRTSPASRPRETTVPRPLTPLDGALVDASAATFAWRGVPGATGYHLQVAADPGFETDVLTVEAGRTNALTIHGLLSASDENLFWRVRASSKPEAWSGYGRFIAASDDAADAYNQERERATLDASREARIQRVAHEAEVDLVPHYNRETSMTSAGDASILVWMLASFAVLILVLVVVT